MILADEQLSGPPRDVVESRLAAWLTTHIATLLKPLIDLSADQALTGMARGIAFQLVENLGILERRAVLEEVRGLSQDERAGLRRHGVRFGAYHIYIPTLLKPAPSTLAAQLWALKHKDLDLPGLAELPAISGSGRTSVSVDPALSPDIYRRFGFRIYGNRAVRIDILERLADLIRPALSWNPGSTGERPPGAIPEGRAFTVTPAMSSLLGASGEDFGVILKALGYRMERRPKPPEPAPIVAPELETPAPSATSEPGGEPAPEQPPSEEPPVQEPTVEPPAREPPAEEPPVEEPTIEPPAEEPPAEQPPVEEPPVTEPTAAESPREAAVVEAAVPSDVGAPSASAEAAVPGESAEPEMIEVWRLGSMHQRREPKPPRDPAQPPRPRRGERTADGEARTRQSAQPRPEGGERRPRRPERDGPRPERDGGRPEPARHEAAPRAERKERPRDRPVDPDNPFAALAALKQELEKSRRE